MGKICKVVVCGQVACGKTALLEQLIYGNHIVGAPMFSTIEDIYVACVETDRHQKEKIRFYDTAGLEPSKPELPKQYMSFADGFILVYDVTNFDSFSCIDKLKREIDKQKDKKDVVIIALGNKCDLGEHRQVDFLMANKWSQREKVKLWEVSVVNRNSLMDGVVWLASRMTQPQTSAFARTLQALEGLSAELKFW